MTETVNTFKKTFSKSHINPLPGSAEEKALFNKIQQGFTQQFEIIFPDKLAPRTVVIIPSFSLDEEILSKVTGHIYYEERLLCLLMLLRMPLTKIIYVTSVPVDNLIIDYYLHLLPGITGIHARQRLTMLSCYDASAKSLTKKILERPRLIQRIKQNITDTASAHLTCFNITSLEKTLAVQLGIPLFGTDPDLFYEGTKSGGRKIFKAAGVCLPAGFEDLKTREDVVKALAALKKNNPALKKAVIKMNDGFSGEGNAIYYYPDLAMDDQVEKSIRESLPLYLKILAKDLSEDSFFEKIYEMGGITEEFIDADEKTSPSVQCLINPLQQADVLSTHDQLLGGDDGQIFIGASFPANPEYNVSLAEEGKKIACTLAKKGALGRFAVDFISVKHDNTWKHYAIEINLRKGGTTHPYFMLQFLTDGMYDEEKGEYRTASGNKRFYFSTDNVSKECYKGLTPGDLIDIAMFHSLMYDGATQEGVMFHLVGALSQFGKLGLVCIGDTAEKAKEYYEKVIYVLDKECEE
ncbi:MAG: peptide ligase PGM1-related protein [Bacteroidota bacterium]|nr:peptide ligase PGM1-related protein [Bacteroidota bacterium]